MLQLREEETNLVSVGIPLERKVRRLPERRGRYGTPSYMIPKRMVDFTLSALGLLVLLPVFALIGLLIALKDGFPVVFRHERLGRKGKVFHIYKFRTMVKNADEVLKRDTKLMEEFQKNFKLERDPRITPIGRFLRKTSLDELPQLINVLKGEMALVGPRPIVLPELAKYGDAEQVYLAMIPGCAGLWQCSGRSDTSYPERIDMDREYFENASLRNDARILFRTLGAMCRGIGAR